MHFNQTKKHTRVAHPPSQTAQKMLCCTGEFVQHSNVPEQRTGSTCFFHLPRFTFKSDSGFQFTEENNKRKAQEIHLRNLFIDWFLNLLRSLKFTSLTEEQTGVTFAFTILTNVYAST